jgi:Rel homology dimerisation domain/Rel homology DNA-binding domain
MCSFQGLGIIQAKKGSEMREVLTKKLKAEKEFEESRKLSEEEVSLIASQTDALTKKVNINQVCLGFTAFYLDEATGAWNKLCDTVYSNVINNQKNAKHGDLKICRISTVASEAKGGQEVFMFVSKVDKNLIGVKFYELHEDGSVKWEADGKFGPADVHHQYGIYLTTPPYESQNIGKQN